jgi:plastocyanin
VLFVVFKSIQSKFLGWLQPPAARSNRTRHAVFLLLSIATGAASAAPFRVTIADPTGAPIADAVVTLRAGNAATNRQNLPVIAQPVVIQQVDREFVPKVTVLPLGARVSLPNNDVVPHSVYSFSPAQQFEFDVYVGSAPRVLTLDKLGVITLGCNIHDWMVGYVIVVDTPLAMKTDAKGVARFANVSDGAYELRIWHPQQRAADHVAQVTASDQSRAQAVTLDVAPPRVRYKPPLTLKTY